MSPAATNEEINKEPKELETENSNRSLFGMSLSSPTQALNDDSSSCDSSWSDKEESGGGLFGKPLNELPEVRSGTTGVAQTIPAPESLFGLAPRGRQEEDDDSSSSDFSDHDDDDHEGLFGTGLPQKS